MNTATAEILAIAICSCAPFKCLIPQPRGQVWLRGTNDLRQSVLVSLLPWQLSTGLIADGMKHKLTPGMQVTAEIHLGTRTIPEYLLSPVMGVFQEAARER